MNWKYVVLEAKKLHAMHSATLVRKTMIGGAEKGFTENVLYADTVLDEVGLQQNLFKAIGDLGASGYELFFINPEESNYYLKKAIE